MKKLIPFALVAALAVQAVAQEKQANEPAQPADHRAQSAVWPSFIALGEYPDSPDIVGFRFTIPFSTRQENVTGFDLGLWGRSIYFEGLQLNILRNDVKDGMSGFQVGLYNSIGRGEMLGLQAGLWNEAGCIRGLQAGLVNTAGEAQGFQIGIINRCETMYGFQLGVINVIREAEVSFLPICNIGF